MLLYLIRHAQSQNNARPEHERIEDPPLSDLGQEQAKCLADWIPALQLTHLFTSPFLRTMQTAEQIRVATGLTGEVRTELHELGGCYAGYGAGIAGRPGMNRLELEQQFPHFQVEPSIEGVGWWGSQPYESFGDAQRRGQAILDRTQAEFAHTEHRVAYVMHADIKGILLDLLDFQLYEPTRNTAVTKVSITPAGNEVIDYNLVPHLAAEMISS